MISNQILADTEIVTDDLKTHIFNQLLAAKELEYQTIILGPFGIGPFEIPIAMIEIYKMIIKEYFQGAFNKIIFCGPDLTV